MSRPALYVYFFLMGIYIGAVTVIIYATHGFTQTIGVCQ